MNPEPWVLILVLSLPTAEPLILKTSPEGCAAFVADVLTDGYRPNVYTPDGAIPVAFSMCGPSSTLKSIMKTTARLYAPCRGGPNGICSPVEAPPVRTPRRAVQKPAATPAKPSTPWRSDDAIR